MQPPTGCASLEELSEALAPLSGDRPCVAAPLPAGCTSLEEVLGTLGDATPRAPAPPDGGSLEEVLGTLGAGLPLQRVLVPLPPESLEEALFPPGAPGRFALPRLRMPWHKKQKKAEPTAWTVPLHADLPPLEIRDEDRWSRREWKLAQQLIAVALAGYRALESDRKMVKEVFRKRRLPAWPWRKPVPTLDEAVDGRNRLAAYAVLRNRLQGQVHRLWDKAHAAASELHLLQMFADGKKAPPKDFDPEQMFVTVPWDLLARAFMPGMDVSDEFTHDRMASGLAQVVDELKMKGETSLAGRHLVTSEMHRMGRATEALRELKVHAFSRTVGLEHTCRVFDKNYEKALKQAAT